MDEHELHAQPRLDDRIDAVLHGGDGSLPDDPRPSWWRADGWHWSWLLFPLAGFLLWRQLLRLVVGSAFALAPLIAALLVIGDAIMAFRKLRRRTAQGANVGPRHLQAPPKAKL